MSLDLSKIEYTFSNHRDIITITFIQSRSFAVFGWEVKVDGKDFGFLPKDVFPSPDVARVFYSRVPPLEDVT